MDILSPSTHHSKVDGKRVPAYGIGVEVEMDIDNDMAAGMAAVARWTGGGESRREAFLEKLNNWLMLHPGIAPVPPVPRADLPRLSASTKTTSLTPPPPFSLSIALQIQNRTSISTIAFPQSLSSRLQRPETELTPCTPRTPIAPVAEVLLQLSVHQLAQSIATAPNDR
ncbi:hypothetical protein B0H14DRAFT_3434442 [Mycena olivaceomarginata]|nr:hypothetical protein B0H14DRAFT_3434442 [Mycena olivaceomarginata]